MRPEWDRGVAGLKEIARFEPYIAGSELTLADFTAAIHLPLVSLTSKAIYGEDALEALPAVKRHRDLMAERPSMQRVKAERRNDVPKFMQHRPAVAHFFD